MAGSTGLGIGLMGCGAIGTVLARNIDNGKAGNVHLITVYDVYSIKAEKLVQEMKQKPKVAKTFAELVNDPLVQLLLEASSQSVLKEHAIEVLEAGKDLMAMSVGALVESRFFAKIHAVLAKTGRKIFIPSGAIAGLDGVEAAAVARVDSVILTTTKPPRAFIDAPGLINEKIDLNEIRSPTELYWGPAAKACKLFPANINVAATLSLAGVGKKRTMVRIIADPGVHSNIHEIEVRGECGILKMKLENVPSIENPKTSCIAILSALATLKKMTDQIQIGT